MIWKVSKEEVDHKRGFSGLTRKSWDARVIPLMKMGNNNYKENRPLKKTFCSRSGKCIKHVVNDFSDDSVENFPTFALSKATTTPDTLFTCSKQQQQQVL